VVAAAVVAKKARDMVLSDQFVATR
jgi:hypothetical protein